MSIEYTDDFVFKHNKRNPEYHTQAIGVFYVISPKDYELLTISFPELERQMNALPSVEETLVWDKEKRDAVMNEYYGYDNTIESLTGELDEYSDAKNKICAELWETNPCPKFYVLKFDLDYKWTYDSYTGESDFEMDFEYTTHDLKDEWKNVDLYDKGTVLYSREFEKNNESVIVTGLKENNYHARDNLFTAESNPQGISPVDVEVIDEKPLYDGVYYVTEKDNNGVKEEVLIEMNSEEWFISPELAHKSFIYNLYDIATEKINVFWETLSPYEKRQGSALYYLDKIPGLSDKEKQAYIEVNEELTKITDDILEEIIAEEDEQLYI